MEFEFGDLVRRRDSGAVGHIIGMRVREDIPQVLVKFVGMAKDAWLAEAEVVKTTTLNHLTCVVGMWVRTVLIGHNGGLLRVWIAGAAAVLVAISVYLRDSDLIEAAAAFIKAALT